MAAAGGSPRGLKATMRALITLVNRPARRSNLRSDRCAGEADLWPGLPLVNNEKLGLGLSWPFRAATDAIAMRRDTDDFETNWIN